jgi:hypothetical protein
MTKARFLGIWLDHTNAHLIEYSADVMTTQFLHSKFTQQDREEGARKSEHLMHNKEQQEQNSFYKILGEAIKKYEEVILFGPTDAKVELLHFLRKDHLFQNIKIDLLTSDKLSENQQHAFVKKHFLKRILQS